MIPASVIDAIVAEAVRQYMDAALSTSGAPEAVALVAYTSDADLWSAHPEWRGHQATDHAVMLERVREALEARGARVRIVPWDAQDYHAWVAAQGMGDTPAARAAWAASHPQREGDDAP